LPYAVAGSPYSQQLTANSSIGSPTWSLVDSPPSWLSISPTGLLSGTPPANAATPELDVDVSVHDTTQAYDTETFPLEVRPPAAFTGGTIDTGFANQPYDYSLVANGGSGSYTWSSTRVGSGFGRPHGPVGA
jgi:hypothetical protein